MLSDALSKVPVLRVAIDLNIASAFRSFACPLIPRSATSLVEDCVKERTPRDDDQDNEMRRSEARTGPVVGVNGRNCCGPALGEVISSTLGQVLRHPPAPSES